MSVRRVAKRDLYGGSLFLLTALCRVVGQIQRLGKDLSVFKFRDLTLLEPEGLCAR